MELSPREKVLLLIAITVLFPLLIIRLVLLPLQDFHPSCWIKSKIQSKKLSS